LKEAERRILERQRELEAANNELDGFTYSVSHDLRAPLRAIDGFGRILIEDHAARLDAEGRRVLEVIRRNVGRMGQLIDDLLAFSRLGRDAMQPGRVDMTTLARTVLGEITAVETDRVIDARVAGLPDALGDPRLLRQVWVNLLGNAVKYTRQKSPAVIQVTGRAEDDEVVYTVKDNGVGFDMTYAGKLFMVFQRLHKASEFEGTGVGLALVQRIVARHRGRVWAEARPGEGAAFSFALPRKDK
jgi:light-regulated signal transduction histidine kinase (bacteriophytochrome)